MENTSIRSGATKSLNNKEIGYVIVPFLSHISRADIMILAVLQDVDSLKHGRPAGNHLPRFGRHC